MNDIGHQLLKSRILHPGDALCAREVRCGLISARLTLTCVIYQKFRDLTERPPLLAVIDDQSGATCLRRPDAFLNAVSQIGATGADVGAENVRAVTLVVDPTSQWTRRITDGGRVTKDIQSGASDRRQENMQVAPCHQLR